MRVLGIDIGLKRTGLAMSDELGISVSILPNLQARSRAMALEKLLSLVNEFGIKVIVIGLPQARTEHSKAVVSRVLGLEQALQTLVAEQGLALTIALVDETLTSKHAAQRLASSGVSRKQRKIKLDGAAAAIMVEHYLISHKPKDS